MAPTPYSGTRSGPHPATYPAPTAGGPLDAVVTLPGSKSLTNRELVLSALADGPSRLRAPLVARDTRLMADALRTLGATIDEDPRSGDWVIQPIGAGESTGDAGAGRGAAEGRLERAATRTIDVGLAGTVMRFVPPLAAFVAGDVVFDGDEHARRRPMATTIDSLRKLGVEVTSGRDDRLPFTVHGSGNVRGGEIAIDASASSQFVSGLLNAAPRFELGLVLRHTGERLPSLPHIEMTIACLAARGVEVGRPEPGVWSVVPQPIAGRDIAIEPDLSNAAPFLAAALIAGGTVQVSGWPARSTQVGMLVPRLLDAFGPDLHGADLDLAAAGELAPTLAGLAALASTPSRLTGIGHLRGHETDRLAALAAEINRLGGDVTELEDGLEIRPRPLHGGVWRTYGDHRMATTGALIGLAVPGIEVEDIGTVSKTMPEFVDLWERMLGR